MMIDPATPTPLEKNKNMVCQRVRGVEVPESDPVEAIRRPKFPRTKEKPPHVAAEFELRSV